MPGSNFRLTHGRDARAALIAARVGAAPEFLRNVMQPGSKWRTRGALAGARLAETVDTADIEDFNPTKGNRRGGRGG